MPACVDTSAAADGSVAFPSFAAARLFLLEFDPTVTAMELHWGDVRVEPLSADTALLSAPYDEVITHVGERRDAFGGFFTGTAVRTEEGWKLRNVHWSSPPHGSDPKAAR